MTATTQQSPFQISLVPPDEEWPQDFAEEFLRLAELSDGLHAFIDHVGSTAVAEVSAKPFIDILVTIPDWKDASAACEIISAQGYELVETVTGSDPRFYFTRSGHCDRPGFMVHVTTQTSRFGKDMLEFRDALRFDRKLAKSYVALKIELAQAHPDNLEDYTAGKASFVLKTLARWKGAYDVNRLLTHQAAESHRGVWLQFVVIIVQLALATLAADSVLTDDGTWLAEYAIAGGVLVILWVVVGQFQRKHRAAGDQARRAVLVRSGLGDLLSQPQLRSMMEQFSIDVAHMQDTRIEDHFASRRGPGIRRLAEMLIESAYWTRHLQAGGAWLFGGYLLTGLARPIHQRG